MYPKLLSRRFNLSREYIFSGFPEGNPFRLLCLFSLSSHQYRYYCYCGCECCQQAQYIRHRTRIISCYYWWNHRLYRYAYRLILIIKITVINDRVTLCVIQCLKDYQCLSLQLCGIKCEGYCLHFRLLLLQ